MNIQFDWHYQTAEGVINRNANYKQTVYQCKNTQAIKLIRYYECQCSHRGLVFYKITQSSKNLIDSIEELINQLNEKIYNHSQLA